MSRTVTVFLFAVAFALMCVPSSAQVQTGTPPFGSYAGGSTDVINLANNNVHITIPVRSRPGRGTDFMYSLTYDSSIWYPVGVSGSQSWQPLSSWGWASQTPAPFGTISYTHTQYYHRIRDPETGQWIDCYNDVYNNWTYKDELGTTHSFPISVNQNDCGTSVYSASAVAPDGSGYTMYANTTPSGYVVSRSGAVINPNNATIFKDSNGNQITGSSGTFTDTLGTTALSIAGSPPNQVSLTYNNSSGNSVSATIYYQAYTVKTYFGASSSGNPIVEYGPSNVSLVDHITLPNGKQYSFTYEPTPSGAGCTPISGTYASNCVTARIASITLPTGGTISYAYSGGTNGIFSDGSAATLTRTTSDGTWTYQRTQNTAPATTMTITAPQLSYDTAANVTVIQFQGLYETQRQVYQGSTSGTLLQTTNTCYNGAAAPCTGTAITLPISRRTVLLQPGPGTLQSKTDTFYNTYGLPTEIDEFDFGSGGPASTPTRKTKLAYTSLGNGIADHPASIAICTGTGTSPNCGGTGTQVAYTTFGYDQSAVTATTGVPQHVAVTGARGNLTTVSRWISGTTYATSTMTYYDTGNVKVATDPGSHTTTFSYTDSWGDTACAPPANTQAFATEITNHLSQKTQLKYYQCTAQAYSIRDPNDIANNRDGAKLIYNDSLDRPTQIDFADSGRTTLVYDDTARTVTTTQKQTGTVNVSETDQFDQLGRITQRQLPASRKVDVVYDQLGRVWKTSNPYVSAGDSTYGLTQTRFDALGRVAKVIRQDGTSTALLEYANNEVRATDETSKRRLAAIDGLGRVTKVCEVTAGNTRSPNAACGFTGFTESGYLTASTFDVLDNVTQTVQGTGSQQQTRTMSYDGLGRITSATIPEVSTSTSVSYGYDADSKRTSVTDPRGTVNFVYDVLHRLTQKKYGTTLVAQYSYDGTAANNAIGRLITDTDGAAGSGADHSDYTYDPLGRVVSANRTVSGTAYTIGYQYDFMGNLTQLSYPSGRKVSYSYTANNELNKVTDTTGTSFDYVSGATYSSLGTLQQLSFANSINTTLGWNNLARLTSILTQKTGNAALLDLGYSYYANGQIQQITNNSDGLKTEKYTYDDLGRLFTAQRGPDNNIQRKYSYDYDRFGNRWAQTLTAGTQGYGGQNSFNYPDNRVTTSGFSYDNSGNVSANGPGTSFTYNQENFLTAASTTLGAPTYTVDTAGRRTKKTVSGTTTNYFYSGSQVISELQGSTWTDYVFFGDIRVAQQSGNSLSAAKFLHRDHLGSTRVCTDGGGNSLGTCDYEPFGEFQPGSSCSALPTNYRFAGTYYDSETGLYYTWFRQYDPNQGRWMGVDPVAGLVTSPQSLDRYAYAANDPGNLIDPLGLDPDCPEGCHAMYRTTGDHKRGPYLGCSCDFGRLFVDVNGGCMSVYKNGFFLYNSCQTGEGIPRDRGDRNGPTMSPQPREPKLQHCSFKALFLNSLDLKFKIGLEGKLKGILELGASITLKSLSGETGGELSAKALTIGAEYSSKNYSGNVMANPETSEFNFTAGPWSYNPFTKEGSTNWSKTLSKALTKGSIVIGIGGEISFDASKFNQQAATCDVIE